MSLESIANITITASTATPTQQGFGTPLIAAYHVRWGTITGERARSYTSLAGMTADGFLTTDAAYKIAAVVFSQNPRPERVKVGRRASAFTQLVRLVPAAPSTGKVYSITIGGSVVTYTALGGDTLAAVCTALATAITALPNVTASGASGTHVDVTTDAAGNLVAYEGWTETLALQDRTTDPGVAADLAAIRAYDPDWYGLLLDSNSEAEINAAAPWAEANEVFFFVQNGDDQNKDSAVTTDVFSDLKAGGYARTVPFFHPSVAAQWFAAGMLGDELPHDPGSRTLKFKRPRGVASYALSATQKTNLHNKNANTLTVVGGLAIVEQGKSASGEWADVTRFLDWVRARGRERVFAVLANTPKLPYTDSSVEVVKGEIQSVLDDGVEVKGFAAGTPGDPDDPTPTVTAPKVKDVPAVDRANRHLPDIKFSARLAGAIHSLTAVGTVSV